MEKGLPQRKQQSLEYNHYSWLCFRTELGGEFKWVNFSRIGIRDPHGKKLNKPKGGLLSEGMNSGWKSSRLPVCLQGLLVSVSGDRMGTYIAMCRDRGGRKHDQILALPLPSCVSWQVWQVANHFAGFSSLILR